MKNRVYSKVIDDVGWMLLVGGKEIGDQIRYSSEKSKCGSRRLDENNKENPKNVTIAKSTTRAWQSIRRDAF